jgi:hypothetical protein
MGKNCESGKPKTNKSELMRNIAQLKGNIEIGNPAQGWPKVEPGIQGPLTWVAKWPGNG